jgi:cytochrome d ubiquinol oxidase subunit I
MEGTYLWTGNRLYHQMTRFWTGLFAVNFAMAVATGLVMEFQFGTNWGAYARYVGDIFGSALAAEGIFAFFLESGFLAVLVFGWDRVSPRMHFFATLMVALGSIFSAVWIIIANSWQQTPTGFMIDPADPTRVVITDFWAVVFNPSAVIRLIHVLLGALLLGSFFVLSVSAYYVLRRRHQEFAQKSFRIGLIMAAVTSALMPATGHFHAKLVARTQPAKLAALEGHFHTGKADLHLLGWPDAQNEKVYGLPPLPGGLSFLCHEDFNAPVTGLDRFRPADRPAVLVPFLAFHLMVVMGLVFIGLSALGLFFWWRGTLFAQRWLMGIFLVAVACPYVANEAGWVACETGRQPFVVYPANVDTDHLDADGFVRMEGGLRTEQGLSNRRVVTGDQVLTTIVLFSLIYLLLFVIWVYVIYGKIEHGPEEVAAEPPPTTKPEELLEVATRLSGASGYTLTQDELDLRRAEKGT